MNPLTQKLLKLDSYGGHSTDQYFRWMIDDCLALFSIRTQELPPVESRQAIRELSQLYAKAIVENPPFTDLLGDTYQELASNGHKKHLGQFFTPMAVAKMMAMMTVGDPPEESSDQLIRCIDPTCGSGVMMLAMADVIMHRGGPIALGQYSFTGIDLDRTCARMAPLQLLANGLYHGAEYGELCFYQGNALGPDEKLNVVLHATRSDLPPQTIIPANHPARIEAVKEAVKARNEQFQLFG